ncbi:pentatricopeptide repeat-containing protein At3g62470, mitochondrial-like [Cucumis melo]|uniref:Pentatricopeptide repeat-containing protein At3g62470, mitochondrial-like n=1 Tax=Cucumis melo TaxID=3656 RepID=A0ABM3L0U3_CUCME|nr:pentatricopeptide repeat-containing protein At3g62470, mitochondrial-like [Cucumis melo]
MEIPCLSRNLRNFSNPYFYSIYSFAPYSPFPLYRFFSRFYTTPASDSAAGSSLICNSTSQSVSSLCLFERCNGRTSDLNLALFRHHYRSCRSFSSFSLKKLQRGTGNINLSKPIATSEKFWQIIDIIQINQEDLESKLDSLNVRLTNVLVVEILGMLNKRKISAFRFFNWVSVQWCRFPSNSDVYSLLIDNFGRLDDYEGILPFLIEFSRKGIELNHKAFGFLLPLANEDSMKSSVIKLVKMLNKAEGTCRISGVKALIEMFCSVGSSEMAKFVIEITEKRSSFYYIIVREQCQRKDFEGARCTLDEMRQAGCLPDSGIFNYLLSSLCKNDKFGEAHNLFEEMLEQNCPPNSLSFEVIICHLCKIGNIESALGFLDTMVARGLQPRLSTHATFVKSYFYSRRYEEAYQYAVDSSSKYVMTQNATYSLLATLHEKRGNLVDAQKILSELVDAGLKPNFHVCKRVLKKLQVQGREDLANDLKGKLSNVGLQIGIRTE